MKEDVMMMKHWGLCLAIVGAAGLALLAGLPAIYLLVLACPLMMLAMMFLMPGMHGSQENHRHSDTTERDGFDEYVDRR
ncbi:MULTISPECIES: hypothetical protein [Nocardioides]|uniref:DUF2933 domain-containing protein n=1 Tax=Nocardioides vastitatis TaxID=2568655 RepID=A0ABW0ZIY9_9ACTN|nr:hypothetical protein [Nocardioides sp.]THJ06202.1 hypothetical protein E7Z54_06180 [Nocardioides sp.]